MSEITVTLHSGDEYTVGSVTAKTAYNVDVSSGIPGRVGFTGSVGSVGFVGSAGFAGSMGFTGSAGEIGFTGSQGVEGVSVATASVATSNLVITLSDSTLIDAGSVFNPNITANKIQESFVKITDASGTVEHDCTNGQIFSHTSIVDNFTANFTNLDLANNHATTVVLLLDQGSTPYIANSVQISGVGQTVVWQGNTTAPTGNSNKKDVLSFSIINDAGSYTILGQLASFG